MGESLRRSKLQHKVLWAVAMGAIEYRTGDRRPRCFLGKLDVTLYLEFLRRLELVTWRFRLGFDRELTITDKGRSRL